MTTLREAAQQALEALEAMNPYPASREDQRAGALTALRAALAQEAEPMASIVSAEPDAKAYATQLAVAIWRKHYRQAAPQWKPLDDLIGVLTQIDNMTAGMQLTQQAEPSRTHRMRGVAQAAADAARAESGQTLNRVVLEQTEPGGVCARCGGWVCDPVMPQQAEPKQKGARYFTVIYKGIAAGDEARALSEHPKAVAMSWSHAMHDRDEALAALAQQGGRQSATPLEQQAEPVQEPVAWRVMLPDGYQFVYDERMMRVIDEGIHATRQPLYTAPPQRKPLTKESLLYIYNQLPNWGMDMDSLPQGLEKFARAIERAHGIKE